eukprot:jgi/Mesvir1/842/Mv17419-RA.1
MKMQQCGIVQLLFLCLISPVILLAAHDTDKLVEHLDHGHQVPELEISSERAEPLTVDAWTHTSRMGRNLLQIQTDASQKQALLDMKNSLTAASFDGTWAATWTDGTDPCRGLWTNLACDTGTPRAIVSLKLDVRQQWGGTINEAHLGALTSLKSLWLSCFGCVVSGTFPDAFGNMPSLEYLQVSSFNYMTGTLPASTLTLPALKTIYIIQGYAYSGTIPDTIDGLTSLEVAVFNAVPRITGTFPASVGKALNLQQWRSENTGVSGTIPDLSSLTKLKKFAISMSPISGFLPESVRDLDMLPSIEFYYTAVSGTIPSSWSSMASLTNINLEHNRLWGTIPSFIMEGGDDIEGLYAADNYGLCGYFNTSTAPEEYELTGTRISYDNPDAACPVCMDSAAGGATDYGCATAQQVGPFGVPSDAPICFTNSSNDGSFEEGMGIDPNSDAGVLEVCTVCLDNQTGTDMDFGCTETMPYCGDVVAPWSVETPPTQDLNDGDAGFGLFCGNCFDDGNGPAPDTGCTADAPLCLHLGNATGQGHVGICSETLPGVCDLEDVAGVTVVPVGATCPKELFVEGSYALALANCKTGELNLKELMTDLIFQYFKTIPACAIESSLLGLDDARRRHLLQTPAATYLLLLRVYVESRAEGQSILDVMKSFVFGNFLVEALNMNVAQQSNLLDIQASIVQAGAATSDPHFTTPTGDKFDFNGIAGGSYCILTDKQLQVNARFAGAAASEASSSSKPDTRTWMDQVAIMHGSDRILIGAASPPGTPFALSLGSLAVNGEPVISRMHLSKLPSGATVLRKKSRTTITLPAVAVIEVEVVRAGFWEAGLGPGKNFLNLHVKHFNGTQAAHGVLGQSFASRGQVPADGSAARYATSGIFAADCQVNQFFVGHRDD